MGEIMCQKPTIDVESLRLPFGRTFRCSPNTCSAVGLSTLSRAGVGRSVFFVAMLWILLHHSVGRAQVCDPYSVGLGAAKLTTPQWIGDEAIDAVVVLSIDDMRDSRKYETFLRPLLDRLKQINGRAPVSIFTNSIDPKDSQLQSWLKEGLSFEVHTVDHPCPLLCDGDFGKAKSTYDRCVDMMAEIPNSHPVAFRMPCCDSLNTPSPRFWKEIFEKQTRSGNYLAIDSSVFNVFTKDDAELPREIVQNARGDARFRHYLPFKSFVNTIENYPYPYIIGDVCWEFPCVVPSDWEAQNVQQPNNPDTVRDLQRALDATVAKQGVMPVVFHPHGWIRSEQLVEFVDYAVKTYGRRVRFLSFAECLESINANLLAGAALRTGKGNELDVRLVDVNRDGYLDVVRAVKEESRGTAVRGGVLTRIWNPASRKFVTFEQPLAYREPVFMTLEGRTQLLLRAGDAAEMLSFDPDDGWKPADMKLPNAVKSSSNSTLSVLTTRDLNGDGNDELLCTSTDSTTVFSWRRTTDRAVGGFVQVPHLPHALPTADGDTGVRLVDLNEDQLLDLVRSDGNEYSVWLQQENLAWKQSRAGASTDADAIPVIANPDGTNNGAWFHSKHLWVQNENTARLPDLVDRAPFSVLISAPKSDANANGSADADFPLGQAKTLEQSLLTFDTIDGASIEVVASEPQIQDPIAFDWGPDGKLWVVEMGDYPNGANWHGLGDKKDEPGGRVKLLEDRDGDGRFETAHLFLDGLHYPTGVKAWRGGVIVSGAPDIIFAADTNGDNRADTREVLYTGLSEGNQQHRTNGLRWSIDGWLHLANGDSGGVVESMKTGAKVKISGRDFRIQPDTGGIETTTGQAQFGRSRDRWGNWFGGNNSHPIWHYVFQEKYVRRNPHFSPPSARREIAEIPGAAPVYPISKTLERFNDFDRANKFTSACSPEIYRGSNGQSAVYVCEPVHNLVHRSAMTAVGPTFSSRRFPGEEQREFLRSTDNWFRPVMVRTGPDDAVWVADMYRMVVEHPEWIPRQWQDRIDHLAGNDKGRIYRVNLPVQRPKRPGAWSSLRKQEDKQLVDLIGHPNGVVSDMAQQELWERFGNAVADTVTALRQAAYERNDLAAAHLLANHEKINTPKLTEIPRQQLPGWIELLESHAARPDEFQQSLLQYVMRTDWRTRESDVDARLAMQCANSLGAGSSDDSGRALARIALAYLANPTDKYVRAAVMSSVNAENCAVVMHSFLEGLPTLSSRSVGEAENDFLSDLVSSAVGYESTAAIQQFATKVVSDKETFDRFLPSVTRLLQRLSRGGRTLADVVDVDTAQKFATLTKRSLEIVAEQTTPEQTRLRHIQLLGDSGDHRDELKATMVQLLSPREPKSLQRHAIEYLMTDGEISSVEQVLRRWEGFTPAMRDIVLTQARRRPEWMAKILDMLEQGAILPMQVGIRHRQGLLASKHDAVRLRAEKVFAKVATDREAIVDKYRSERDEHTAPADAVAGKLLFGKHCATCHQLGDQGRAIGPDLSAISDRSAEAMLVAILDPNRAVEEKYLDYTAVTESGIVHRGILLEESATSLTLATPDGNDVTILRNELDTLKATGRSLMPEGLEQMLSAKDVADVTAYVQSISKPRKRFPGNTPQVAPVRDDGSIRLFAIHAEIYGPKIVLEDRYHNLGFWSAADDRAVWTIDSPQAGEYEVVFDYACAPQSSTNRFQIKVNGEVLGGEVPFTDSWDVYRYKTVGTVNLPKGRVQLAIQSEGAISGFLMDLRTILLYPE